MRRSARHAAAAARVSKTALPDGRPAAPPPTLILEQRFSRRIYRISWLACFSVAVAAFNRITVSVCLSIFVLATSLNYWRHPLAGPRRNLDMAATWSSLGYQVFFSSSALPGRARAAYIATVLVCGAWYSAARYYGRTKRNFNVASACHCGLHVFGNLSNVLLCASHLDPTSGMAPHPPHPAALDRTHPGGLPGPTPPQVRRIGSARARALQPSLVGRGLTRPLRVRVRPGGSRRGRQLVAVQLRAAARVSTLSQPSGLVPAPVNQSVDISHHRLHLSYM